VVALSPAAANGAVLSFMALLAFLLAATLLAVIRLPPPAASPAAEDTQDEAGHWEPKYARPALPPPPLPHRAPGQSGRAPGQPGRIAPASSPVMPPEVSGGPPWDPAPRPRGLRP
jgi:hypothetical protein